MCIYKSIDDTLTETRSFYRYIGSMLVELISFESERFYKSKNGTDVRLCVKLKGVCYFGHDGSIANWVSQSPTRVEVVAGLKGSETSDSNDDSNLESTRQKVFSVYVYRLNPHSRKRLTIGVGTTPKTS